MTTFKQNIVAETKDSTVSELTLNGAFVCYILEDGFREVKVKGKTRIPGGKYPIQRRVEGGFFERYKKKFNHSFVPHLVNVPNFTYILMHIGNWETETFGCLLVGMDYDVWNDGNFWIQNSNEAYQKVYQLLDDAFNHGPVFIEINRDRVAYEDEAEPSADTDTEPEQHDPVIVVTNDERHTPPDAGCGPTVAMALFALSIALLWIT